MNRYEVKSALRNGAVSQARVRGYGIGAKFRGLGDGMAALQELARIRAERELKSKEGDRGEASEVKEVSK